MALDDPEKKLVPTIDGPNVHGVVTLNSSKGSLRLQFTMEAVKAVQDAWGEEDNPKAYFVRANRAFTDCPIDDLHEFAAFASNKTAAQIKSKGFPIQFLAETCLVAWSFAWYGGEPAEETKPEKTKPRATLFGLHWRLPFERVSRGENSGA